MAELTCVNVNGGLRDICKDIITGYIPTRKTESRNGQVLRCCDPVTIKYVQPYQRVLFSQVRDCNPFFHLAECIWMMAGRNDIATIAKFNRRMNEFSDDGITQHGAYGYRWTKYFHTDQIAYVMDILSKDPHSRRAVIQMWDYTDLTRVHDFPTCKDVPCNLNALFTVDDGLLNMTVFNRSNDLIWGAMGANAVHFSFLQEVMASLLGLQSGTYYQITNDLHVYERHWGLLPKLVAETHPAQDYPHQKNLIPLVLDQEHSVVRNTILRMFQLACQTIIADLPDPEGLVEGFPFLHNTVVPMIWAFEAHLKRDYKNAIPIVGHVESDDWRTAGTQWLERRRRNWHADDSNRHAKQQESSLCGWDRTDPLLRKK